MGPEVTVDSSTEVKWLRETGPGMWKEMAGWAKGTNNFQSWQRKFMFSIGKQLDRSSFIPSQKQAMLALSIYQEVESLGFKWED